MSGWLKLALFIVAYELRHSKDGRLLSEEADAWITSNPVLARSVISAVGLALTAHVSNLMPERIDIFSKKFWRRTR